VRLFDDSDRWSHAGAENLYIDGETIGEDGVSPDLIRGSGGEDTFGTAYGGALHKPESNLYTGIPYYASEDVGQSRPAQRVGAYRFFEEDAISFERSLQFRFGCLANDICSTAYWYQSEPHRPFVKMPDWEHMTPGTTLLRGSVDLLSQAGAQGPEIALADPEDGEWWLCGPFEDEHGEAMERLLPAEEVASPDVTTQYDGGFGENSPWRNPSSGRVDHYSARWVRRRANHGFIDFSHVFRPHTKGVAITWPAAAIAQTWLVSDREVNITLYLSWDDHLTMRLRDEKPVDLGNQNAFHLRPVLIKLRQGANKLVLKLNNRKGTTWGAWCFAARAVRNDGQVLVPSVSV
jgi:hypothetical protein